MLSFVDYSGVKVIRCTRKTNERSKAESSMAGPNNGADKEPLGSCKVSLNSYLEYSELAMKFSNEY